MKKWIFLLLLFVCTTTLSWGQTTTTISQTTAGNYTFVVPTGVNSITIECYGAGGGGGGTGANYAIAGGGAGGSYVKYTYSVTPGTTFNYTVGAGGAIGSTAGTDGGTGNSSYFGNTSAGVSTGAIVLAVGGAGGKGNSVAGTNSSNFNGGALGGVGSNSGNLPASGATTNAAGNDGTASIGGVNTVATSGSGGVSTGPNAGAAGAGQTNNSSNGNKGNAPGGGAAGAYRSTGLKSGGLGGDGGVYITYTLPNTINIFSTTSSWLCPAGVSKVLVECWGGGGAGGSASSKTSTAASTGGGGAGGAYSNGTLSVISGTNYNVTVATAVNAPTIPATYNATTYNTYNGIRVNGNPSWFDTASTLYAEGGQGGQSSVVYSGTTQTMGLKGSGSKTSSIGTTTSKGGDGFTTANANGNGGNGGSSGGSSGDGNSATSSAVGAALSTSDGAGGFGGGTTGNSGGTPGGGGGGARAAASGTPRDGGAGGAGQVIVNSYAVPTIQSLSITSANLNSTGVTLIVTGTNFYPNAISQINWNGTPITTTYVSSTSLSAVIDANLTTGGTFPIGITNSGTYGVSTSLTTLNFTVVTTSSATDYFRSAVAGNWATASNWQSSSDNNTWITSTLVPDVNAKGITIRNGFDINSNSSITADDITINSGATLTISSGTFTLNDGSATVDMQVNGTLTRTGGTFTQSTSGIAFGANATYNHAIVTSTLTLPVATWNATSTCNVTGINNSTQISGGSTIGQTFGNFIWNNSAASAFMNVENSAFTVAGTLTIGSSSGSLFSLANPATATTYNYTINSIVINGGQFDAVDYLATVNLTVTNGISLSSGYFVTSNASGNATVTAGSCTITGGVFYIAGSTGNGTFTTTNDLTVSSISSSIYGTLIVSDSSGIGVVNAGNDLILSGDGFIKLINNASSPTTTINITRDLKISGTSSQISLEKSSSTSGVAIINVGRDFSSTTSSSTYQAVDFGTGTVSGNIINIGGNFSKSGNGFFQTASSNTATGFSFNGTGTTQTFSYSGTNSNYTSYIIKASAKVQLLTDLTLGIYTGPNSTFTVALGGTLDFSTFAIKAGSTTEPSFITQSGANLITSNTNGFGGVATSGSLQNFGSIGATTASGRATFATGVNYTFNGATTLPFPIPTSTSGTNNFGIPASINVNASITSNMITNLSVSSAINVNSGGTFALNSTNNNSVNLNGAALTIFSGGTFDNNGENQIINGSGSPSINITGKFITRDIQGFVGANTAIPSITPILNSGSTVEYGLSGDQAVQGGTAPTYQNVTFSGSGTKTLVSANAVVGTITVSGTSIFDAGNNTFGGSGTNVTMTGTSQYRLGGSGLKPDATGTYSLAAGTTIEFYGTSATNIRSGVSSPVINYYNVIVNGSNISSAYLTNAIQFQSGGTFNVKNGATFKFNNTSGFNGGSNTAISNTNNPTIQLDSGSTVEYAGASQTLTPISSPNPYYNLTLSGSGTKSIATSSEILVGNNLNVNAGILQIDTDKLLTVTNMITNTSGNDILIKNKGNLVQINDGITDSGTIKMTRTSRSMTQNDYIYWGSPVVGDVSAQISATNFDASYMWDLYGTVDGSWNSITATTPGRGFITRVSSLGVGTKDFDFTGVPNNGVVSVPHALSYTHGIGSFDTVATGNTILLANPYPSAINAASFISANNNSTGNIGGTLYFWTSFTPLNANGTYTTNDYASWNATGATGTIAPSDPSGIGSSLKPTGKIAAGQGFFAQIYDDADIVFNNSMRVRSNTDNGQFFRNGLSPEKHSIWLSITNNNHAYRQTLVGYVFGATNDRDIIYDGDAFTDNEVNLYSVLDSKPMVIQGRALPFAVSDYVPLGYKVTTAGDYTINLDEVDGLFAAGQSIYIEDVLTSTIHELTQTPYTFTSASGVFDHRFVLRYTDATLGIPTTESSNTVHVYTKDHQIFVQSEELQLKEIMVYDVLGRLLTDTNNINDRVYVTSRQIDQQILIVKIKLENGQVITKKVR